MDEGGIKKALDCSSSKRPDTQDNAIKKIKGKLSDALHGQW
jgi:hypothetical protein